MALDPKLANAAQQGKGLVPNTQFFSPFPFAGMNVNGSAIAIDDREFTWNENFLRLGDGKLRTAWDAGSAFYTAPTGKSIVYFFFYTIGSDYFVAVFLSDGSAVQVSWPAQVQTPIGPAGTFYLGSSGFLPGCVQWGVQYLLIGNRNTPNDYWIWDGTLLYESGTAAPQGAVLTSGGLAYNSTPVATPYGGHGTGVVIDPVVNAGSVVEANLTNVGSGYEVGDVPQIQFSGGGSDTGAILTANLGAGTVAAANITAIGSGYTTATVAFSGGGGVGAAGTATIGGGVSSVAMTAFGTGYTFATVSFTGGAGSGAEATATVSQGVNDVEVTAGGSLYTTATVSFFGGGGSGATATATITTGAITGITITNPGSGYSSVPTVTISGDGSGATATASISGLISAITVTDPGTGYTSAPTVVITGDGTAATATASISASGVTGITITSPGSGYSSAPTITITGDGTGATAVAILTPTGISGVSVVDPGSGYFLAPNITFVGGNGTGATGVVQLVGTSIAKVNVTNGGQNYNQIPVIYVLGGGGGSGANLQPILGGGQVIAINVISGGSGYTTNVEILILPKGYQTDHVDPGSGATATAIFQPTTISGVIMSSYGIGYTDAPAIEITPGANNSASGILSLMPYGVSGSTLETFLSRVWIGNPAQGQFSILPPGGNFSITAPGSLTDVATSAGGLIFVNSDRFLQTQYVAIRQSNSYIYFLGDGSVSVGSNVQTTGNPPTTTFNYQTVDTETGCSWRDSVADFGRQILFANETGVFSVLGGAVVKLSAKLDDLFINAIFPPTGGALTPSASIITLFDVKHYLMLMTVKDPDTGNYRNVMLTWNERDWTITSQTPALTLIGPQKVSSTFTTWGTDGKSLYALFQQPSATLTKRLDTKQYGAPKSHMEKQLDSLYLQATDLSGTDAGVDLNVEFAVSGLAVQSANSRLTTVPSGTYEIVTPPEFTSPSPFFAAYGAQTGPIAFVTAQARITTTSPDFVIGNLLLSWYEVKANR